MDIFDKNEFSFDALFKNDDFKRYESNETKRVFTAFCEYAESAAQEEFLEDEFYDNLHSYKGSVFNDAFKQGFCFAVKSLKFMLKI